MLTQAGKVKKRISGMIKVLLIILVILVVLFFVFAFLIPDIIMSGKRHTFDESRAWQNAHYDTSFYDKLKKTNYVVKGFENYELHVQLLENPEQSTKYMILSHGYTDNRIGDLKYAKMYIDFGFNCIIYDLRGHGENLKTITTYGIREGKDLKCIIDDTRKRYKDVSFLGLHGESLGAATTITSLKYKPEVDFVVADCGFSDIENVLLNLYKNHHIPTGLYSLADKMCKLRYHVSLSAARPIDSLDENTVPILFMHGADDTFIPPKNTEDMAARTKGYRELHMVPKAEHALSIITDQKQYRAYVKEFLNKICN